MVRPASALNLHHAPCCRTSRQSPRVLGSGQCREEPQCEVDAAHIAHLRGTPTWQSSPRTSRAHKSPTTRPGWSRSSAGVSPASSIPLARSTRSPMIWSKWRATRSPPTPGAASRCWASSIGGMCCGERSIVTLRWTTSSRLSSRDAPERSYQLAEWNARDLSRAPSAEPLRALQQGCPGGGTCHAHPRQWMHREQLEATGFRDATLHAGKPS